MKLVIDVPPGYEPIRKTRSVAIKRKPSLKSSHSKSEKRKHLRAKAIKCEWFLPVCSINNHCSFNIIGANGSKQEISANDPSENNAIQCCHQAMISHGLIRWISVLDGFVKVAALK
jgi:hypothetical protein